jgi:hypothetical protein
MNARHTFKLGRNAKKFFGTRKTTINVVVVENPSVRLVNTYWDGGSRNTYYAITKSGIQQGVNYSTNPPQFRGTESTFEVTDTLALVEAPIFCGKEMPLRIFVKSLDGWNFEQ